MLTLQKIKNARRAIPKDKYLEKGVKMEIEDAYDFVRGLSEEDRMEAFLIALGMLNEDEFDDMLQRCQDIIEAAQKRLEKGGFDYIE